MVLFKRLADPRPPLPLHLPAHGRGRGLAPALRRLLRRDPGCWDLPELPEIGGPLESEGAVAAAQEAAADLLGARRCWFGVNGASGLLQVGLLALAKPGQRVLLPRNVHRSLLHGCVLAQLRPVLFDLPFDPLSGLWEPPSAAALEHHLDAALAEGPLAAVVLVSPSYHGRVLELERLIAAVHRRDLPVLLDEAHGAHLGLDDRLPAGGLACGADLVVQSLQKAAGGLAQSAVLLQGSKRLHASVIERALLWLQTSSPNALLLASSAAALSHLHSPAGRRQLRRAIDRSLATRQRLSQFGLPLLPSDDPLRLSLHTAAMGINGLDADSWLMNHGVIAELPEPGVLTFCPGLTPPRRMEHRLPRSLLLMQQQIGRAEPLPLFTAPPLPALTEPEMPLVQAWRAPAERVALVAAAGRIAAEPLCPYPPGIPLLIPGERLDRPRVDWLVQQHKLWPGQIADTVTVVAE
jgi:lysine decarboxylase